MSRFIVFLFCISALYNGVSLVNGFDGLSKSSQITDFTELNQCGYTELWRYSVSAAQSHFAAVSEDFWQKGNNCGRCALVTPKYAGFRPVTVMITSYYKNTSTCYDCGKHGLFMSTQSYREMHNYQGSSRISISWKFVPCPSSFVNGNMEIFFAESTQVGYIPIQVRNAKQQVKKMQLITKDGKKYEFLKPEQTADSWKGYFFTALIYPHTVTGPFKLQITSTTGQVIEENFSKLPSPKTTVVSKSQFH